MGERATTDRGAPCPLCHATQTTEVGPIQHPTPATVSGVVIDLAGIDFSLRRCRDCGFQFKYPPIPEEKLLACYAQAGGSFGGYAVDPHVRQFDALKAMLERHAPGRRVLDIGCYTGDFLTYLGEGWDRSGVEPSEGAAQTARSQGVQILGATLDDLRGDTPRFDAIVALDLVEHLAAPDAFFQTVARLLNPGGVLLILTGDSDAISWRMQGSLYWYCTLPEHCSFFSRRAIERAGEMSGLRVTEYHRRSHWRSSLRARAWDWVRNVGYLCMRGVRGFGVPKLRRTFLGRAAPGWLSASDHMFCLMTRQPAGTARPAAPTSTGAPSASQTS